MGTERTLEQIDEIRGAFEKLVDEVGGKVGSRQVACV